MMLSSLFWSKAAYKQVSSEFHPFHRHDLNVLVHLWTTGLGVWGGIQLAVGTGYVSAVYVYAALVVLTTPWLTAVLHSAFVYACLQLAAPTLTVQLVGRTLDFEPSHVALLAIAVGYGLQDLSHYLFVEPTYMDSYMAKKQQWKLLVHTFWLMPLVIDAVTMRYCFLPTLLVTRSRNVVTTVASKSAVDAIRSWISDNVPPISETTHVWPHQQAPTDEPTTQLENDAAILAGFRSVFPSKHYDVRPVQGMNELYITAVGAKKDINSDAVFYTPHTDGPYWFLPFCSLYRVLVGVTPNGMVRTRFNLQHSSQDQVVDMYGVLGFDYNRELHWIDHVPNVTNKDRRSLVKLHYIVYPRGWHRYGNFCAQLNTTYNTWARGNFLKTLRPNGLYEFVLAWWIWLTTWFNAVWEENVGWSNLVYIAGAYALSKAFRNDTVFLVLTSFRHYCVYIATFASRQPMVAHGYLMRDAKLYKTLSMMHLARHLLPLVQLPNDAPGVASAAAGFTVTLLATARLGMDRTYFGSELGFVKPQWIHGFPYGTIPHPMIMGQVWAFAAILYWWWDRLSTFDMYLLEAHMTAYIVHMMQEILTSSY